MFKAFARINAVNFVLEIDRYKSFFLFNIVQTWFHLAVHIALGCLIVNVSTVRCSISWKGISSKIGTKYNDNSYYTCKALFHPHSYHANLPWPNIISYLKINKLLKGDTGCCILVRFLVEGVSSSDNLKILTGNPRGGVTKRGDFWKRCW